MVICDVCGQVYDSMKKPKHFCPGPPDLDREATMRDVLDLRRLVVVFRAEMLQMLAKMAKKQR